MLKVDFDLTKFEELIRTVVREELQNLHKQETDRLCTFEEACQLLRVSDSTLRRRIKNGELGYHQQGYGPITFEHREILKYLSTQKKSPHRKMQALH